jgi:Na+:H+ antiporter, NhaA family
MPLRDPWSESDRYVPRTVVQPLQRILRHEAAGGAVMLVAAAIAIVWANSPWGDTYAQVWQTTLRVELGGVLHLDHLSLQTWVNDALMTVFFLLVGVEIKRELVHGELRDARAVALPVIAAIGGMIVPAVIYGAINAGGPGADGWAVPTATDIAFAVGVVTLAGPRVPLAGKIFLLTLAVADDVGAIVVIAVFYTGALSWGWLAAAAAALAVIFVMRRGDVQSLAPYLAVGGFAWLALLESGVHATLIGVALGLLTPAWPLRSPRRFPAEARRVVNRIEAAYYDRVLTPREFAENEQNIAEVARLAMFSTSPLERLERALSPWVAYVVVPVFALANAGVNLDGGALRGVVSDPTTTGVLLGLVAGKTIGVLGATAVAVRLGIARLPSGTTWRHMFGLATSAGIGFTVALFVTSLAFDTAATTDAAKVGILTGSTLAGIIGFCLLRAAPLDAPADKVRRYPAARRLRRAGADAGRSIVVVENDAPPADRIDGQPDRLDPGPHPEDPGAHGPGRALGVGPQAASEDIPRDQFPEGGDQRPEHRTLAPRQHDRPSRVPQHHIGLDVGRPAPPVVLGGQTLHASEQVALVGGDADPILARVEPRRRGAIGDK